MTFRLSTFSQQMSYPSRPSTPGIFPLEVTASRCHFPNILSSMLPSLGIDVLSPFRLIRDALNDWHQRQQEHPFHHSTQLYLNCSNIRSGSSPPTHKQWLAPTKVPLIHQPTSRCRVLHCYNGPTSIQPVPPSGIWKTGHCQLRGLPHEGK